MERGRDWANHDAPFNVASGQTVFRGQRRAYMVSSFFSAFNCERTKRIGIDERTMKASGFDLQTSSPGVPLGKDTVYSAEFSPDGKLAATGGYQNIVQLYDPNTWKVVRNIRNIGSPGVAVSCVRFTSDSKSLFIGSFDGYAGVYRVDDGSTISAFRAHVRPVISAAFTPDGSRVATGSTDKTAKLFNVSTGEQLTTMTGHTSYVYGLSFNPDASRIITTSEDDTARLWETDTGRELIPVFDVHPDECKLLAAGFTTDGEYAYGVTSRRELLLAQTYPWKPQSYPSNPQLSMEKRVELWKRQQINPDAEVDDIDW
jgi:WD40 repeat protein